MVDDYIRAKKIGDREVSRARSRGEYPYLPALDDMVTTTDIAYEEKIGLLEIPIERVVGTKTAGRGNAFSRGFMPILDVESEFGTKWAILYDSALDEGIRDAIQVYEYRGYFYVQEGNKRVSVTRYLQTASILGDVTRVVPKWSEDKDTRIYYEFMKFYRACPLYEITFSQEGGYSKLARIMGLNLDSVWTDDAVSSLRSSFRIFEKAFIARRGNRLAITAGDAFLIYLEVYPMDGLIGIDDGLLHKQMEKLWAEILTKERSDNIALVESPDQGKKDTGILGTGLGKKTRVYTREKPLHIAFFYDKPEEISAWTYGHELGRNYLREKFGGRVLTAKEDDCGSEEKLAQAIDRAVANGADVAFTISPSQMPETLKSSLHYPEVKFLNCSVNLSHSSVRTYYGRMFEAKFLMGALAASQAENHRIGYLEGYPLYGSIANINAFAIGASLVDPKAEIYLMWSSLKEADWWTEAVKKEGIKIFSGQDLIAPGRASREYGVYIKKDDGTYENLATPVWDWGKYYELIVRTIFDGSYDNQPQDKRNQALNYWWGMSAGVIDVITGAKLSYSSRKLIDGLRKAVVSGILHPFDGELHSQFGKIQSAGDERLSNEEIIRMDWLNDNIIGEIPRMDEIKDEAKESVAVGGIVEE
ncbi:MAG: BMP family ABC transporter substrate-binding protein [Lachnospiraceae bacterium]|nr:BMP family ABC transporter substrate-binding protein [Lachnospiraceae bacterium]